MSRARAKRNLSRQCLGAQPAASRERLLRKLGMTSKAASKKPLFICAPNRLVSPPKSRTVGKGKAMQVKKSCKMVIWKRGYSMRLQPVLAVQRFLVSAAAREVYAAKCME